VRLYKRQARGQDAGVVGDLDKPVVLWGHFVSICQDVELVMTRASG
jgi:hypothetical protein